MENVLLEAPITATPRGRNKESSTGVLLLLTADFRGFTETIDCPFISELGNRFFAVADLEKHFFGMFTQLRCCLSPGCRCFAEIPRESHRFGWPVFRVIDLDKVIVCGELRICHNFPDILDRGKDTAVLSK